MTGRSGGWVRSVVALTLLLALYFVAPLGTGEDPLPLTASVLLVVVGGVALAWVISVQAARQVRGERDAELHSLLLLLWLVVALFSTAYVLLDHADPGQLVGVETRLDSVYFTLTTLATVGYGDAHAAGQVARGLVSLQIVFDVLFVALLVRTMGASLRRRVPRPQDGDRHE